MVKMIKRHSNDMMDSKVSSFGKNLLQDFFVHELKLVAPLRSSPVRMEYGRLSVFSVDK